jgi:nucleoside 2-deoxyribosyltransferase
MRVYLAGPINGCTDHEAMGWRQQVKDALGEGVCVDPMRRDYRGAESLNVDLIVTSDLRDIETCDVVLANVWQLSVGTSMECWFAFERKIPVVIIAPPDVSPWWAYVASSAHATVSEAVAHLEGTR